MTCLVPSDYNHTRHYRFLEKHTLYKSNNITCSFEIFGATDVSSIKSAIQKVFQSIPITSGYFSSPETISIKIDYLTPVRIVQIIGNTVEEWLVNVKAHIDRENSQAIHLGVPPLFRPSIYLGSPDKRVLVSVLAHHVVCDGHSFGIIMKKLVDNLENPKKLVDKSVLFSTTTRTPCDAQKKLKKNGQWWNQYLSGYSPPRAFSENYFNNPKVVIDSFDIRSSKKMSRDLGVRRSSVFYAAYMKSLFDNIQTDICIKYLHSNRDENNIDTVNNIFDFNCLRVRNFNDFQDLCNIIDGDQTSVSENFVPYWTLSEHISKDLLYSVSGLSLYEINITPLFDTRIKTAKGFSYRAAPELTSFPSWTPYNVSMQIVPTMNGRWFCTLVYNANAVSDHLSRKIMNSFLSNLEGEE